MSRFSSLSSTTNRRMEPASIGTAGGRGTGARGTIVSGGGAASRAAAPGSGSRKTVGPAGDAVGGTASSTNSRALRAASRIFVEVGDVLLLAGVPDLVFEELGVPDDLVEGRPQVVPQASARVDLRVAHGGASLNPPRSRLLQDWWWCG